MSIRFACSCGEQIEVPDAFAGHEGGCPKCGLEVKVPAPVDEEPITILPAVEVAPVAEESATDRPGRRRQSEYATPTFIVGLVLGILGALACGASLLAPWTDIPQRGGSSNVRGLRALFLDEQVVSDVFGQAPFGGPLFWPLPAATLALGFAGVFFPRRLRGGVLLTVVLASAIAFFVILRMIQVHLLAYTPLARYVDTPAAFVGGGPEAPILGVGVWMMAGAIVVLGAAAAINACRSPGGTLAFVAPLAVVGGFGYSHLHDWYRPADTLVSLYVDVSQELSPVAASPGIAPEAAVSLNIRNRSRRPLVVVPAWGPGIAGPRNASPVRGAEDDEQCAGSWIGRERGEPDLTLHLERPAGVDVEAHGTGTVPVLSGSGGREPYGLVVRRGQEAAITLRFEPAWTVHPWRRTQAGPWRIAVRDGADEVASTSFDVPGLDHEDDPKINDQLDTFDEAKGEAEAELAEIRSGPASGAQLERGFRTTAESLRELRQRLDLCREGRARLMELGAQLSEADLKALLALEHAVDPQTLALVPGFVGNLDAEDADVDAAADKLRELCKPAGQASDHGGEIRALARSFAVDEAESFEQAGRYHDALALLVVLATLTDSEEVFQGRVAQLLVSAVLGDLRQSDARLIKTNGALGTNTSAGAELLKAWNRSLTWWHGHEQKEDMRFATLILQQRAGTLLEQGAIEFLDAFPESAHKVQVLCWLGTSALRKRSFALADEYFVEASDLAESDDVYAVLTKCRKAEAALGDCGDDAYECTCKERDREILCRQIDSYEHVLSVSPVPSDWVEHLFVIDRPAQLTEWVAGKHETIPWLRIGHSRGISDDFRKLVDLVENGVVAWVSTELIERFDDRNVPPKVRAPPWTVKSSSAHPVRPPPTGFGEIQEVHYRSSHFLLVPRDDITIISGKSLPVLEATTDENWLVCIEWKCRRKGGMVAFLPDTILDTPDGRRFLRALVLDSR